MEEPQTQGTILIAEDENLLREVVSKADNPMVSGRREANDGKEASQVGREFKEPIDLLLTDVVMPGMSGPD